MFESLATLAEKPSVSADGLTYSFTLRAAHYADGTPVRADDFVYAIERLRNPKTEASGSSLVTGVRETRTRGERQLDIILEQPDASFPMHFIMPQTAPIPRGWGEDRLRTDPPCSGPYRVAQWNEGRELVLVRNDAAANPAWLDKIVAQLAVPFDVAALRFLRGETDVLLHIDAPTYQRMMRTPAWKPMIVSSPALDTTGIAINTRRPPLDDVRVRQALNLALNQNDLALLSAGRYRVSSGPVPPGVAGFDGEAKPWPHDPAQARALLAQAGQSHLHLRYTVLGNQASIRQAASIQADFAEVGIALDIETVSELVLPAIRAGGDFDLVDDAWGADFPEASNFFASFHSRWIYPAGYNFSRFSNPAIDALIDASSRESNPARRLAMLHEITRRIHDECPWIWLPWTTNTLAHHPDVGIGPFDSLWEFDLRQVWK